jgi:hypothetical protein
MTFPSEAAREDLAKPSRWDCETFRLFSLGATMLLIMAWAGSSLIAQTTMPLPRVLVCRRRSSWRRTAPWRSAMSSERPRRRRDGRR